MEMHLHDEVDEEPEPASSTTADTDMLAEIRSMKSLIEERFSTLAFMDRLQRNPRQVQLGTRLLECGFSPALVRELVDSTVAGRRRRPWPLSRSCSATTC